MLTTSLPAVTDQQINLTTAISMTSLYRANREAILATSYKGLEIMPLSETFNKDAIAALLDLPGCAGIRIYYGMDEQKKVHAILVGVTAANEDMLPASSSGLIEEPETDEPDILERGQRCPPACPPDSPLNS